MDVQILVLRQTQYLRHGSPKTIRCDREYVYVNSQLAVFCPETGTERIHVAANDHEANGLIENANRTHPSFHDRLGLCVQRSAGKTIVAEAVFGKNISVASKKGSAFELLYGRRPRLVPAIESHLPPTITIGDDVQHVARRRLRKMLRTPNDKKYKIRLEDSVAIWRDASG